MTKSGHCKQRECMLLIHGLAANQLFLRPLAKHFSDEGFRVVNWGYPSIRNGVEKNAARLQSQLRDLTRDQSIDRIHVVGHSMGSIVARAALIDFLPSSLGQVVMLAPPNLGSPVARRLAPALGVVCPALHDLADTSSSYVNRLPEPEGYKVGIIAAAYDRVVPLPNTHLANQSDHIVLPFGHSSMLFQRAVADAIGCFIDGGQFCHSYLSLA